MSTPPKGQLNVYFVGIIALVPNDDDLHLATSMRVLMPGTPYRTSNGYEHVMLPPHGGFIAVPTLAHRATREPHFIKKFRFPVMPQFEANDLPEEVANAPLMSFYRVEGCEVWIDAKHTTPFNIVDINVDGDEPSRDNFHSFRWVADMQRYCDASKRIQSPFLDQPAPGASWAGASFDYGRVTVTQVPKDHISRFIDGDDNDYRQQLAEAVRLRTRLETQEATIHMTRPGFANEITFNPSEWFGVIIGSTTIEDIVAPMGSRCGDPFYHHETLYDFSEISGPYAKRTFPVPACEGNDDRVPELGHCVPLGRMYSPGSTRRQTIGRLAQVSAASPAARASSRVVTSQALSLHFGVNSYDSYYKVLGLVPKTLKSCVKDAETTWALARTGGFHGVDGNPVRDDVNATRDALEKGIASAVQQLKGGGDRFFILSHSGHGLPDRRPVWCLHDQVITFDELIGQLNHFDASVNVLVVADSCFSEAEVPLEPDAKQLSLVHSRAIREAHPQDFETPSSFDFYGVEGGPSIYFLSACAADETTPDGKNAKMNSPFTQALYDVLTKGRVDFDTLKMELEKLRKPRHPKLKRITGPDADFETAGPFHL
jgi:hypothetical protein